MCKEFTCVVCRQRDWMRCQHAESTHLHGARCQFLHHARSRKKCSTCRLVEGVIKVLTLLIWQNPWIRLDGRQPEAWEIDGPSCKGREQGMYGYEKRNASSGTDGYVVTDLRSINPSRYGLLTSAASGRNIIPGLGVGYRCRTVFRGLLSEAIMIEQICSSSVPNFVSQRY